MNADSPRWASGGFLLLLVATLFLSGCMDKNGSGKTLAEGRGAAGNDYEAPKAAEGSGAIQGVVVSEEELPIEGAEVGLAAKDVPAVFTNSEGRFAFSHLEPGKYTVVAQKFGYESQKRLADVAAGGVAEVQIRLVATTVQGVEPFPVVDLQAGFVGCSAAARVPTVRDPLDIFGDEIRTAQHVCDTTRQHANYDPFQDRVDILYNLSAAPVATIAGFVFEMDWEGSQAVSRNLWLTVEIQGCLDADAREGLLLDVEGPSPLRQAFDAAAFASKLNLTGSTCHSAGEDKGKDCNAEKCTLVARVRPSATTLGTPADFGVVVNQRFTQYVTTFYNGIPEKVDLATYTAAG